MSKNILFTNPVPLIENGILSGFKQNGWYAHIMSGLGITPEEQVKNINNYVEDYDIDVVFTEFGVGPHYKAIYEYCDKKGICFCLWGIEDTPTMRCWLDQTIDYCHYYFTTTYEMIEYTKTKYNKDIHLLMFGVNPDYHKSIIPNKEKYKCDIGFVGNNYSSRYHDFNEFIYPLVENNYNINIWGNEWWIDTNRPVNLCKYPHIYQNYLGNHEANELYSTVKVGLGLQCNRESFSPYSSQQSMRFAEIMGVGNAIFISPWSQAQENYLGKSGEYAFFPKTSKEMVDNVNIVLNMSDDERINMALKAQKFVYENHNYKDKASKIIKLIG